MDFMNFMNQASNCEIGHRNHANDNCGCYSSNNFNNNGFNYLLPLFFLSGLGQTGYNSNNMVCYPNQPQQYVTPTYSNNNLKYRTKKVRQAYMEVPVSTYQVAQPYCQQQLSVNPGMFCLNGNRSQCDLFSMLLFLIFISKFSNKCGNVCNVQSNTRSCGSCSSEI
ncbi:hypothetical protein [Candidatus Arthromitus sp. SFB-rat-Yit]|uniref:hypothetical protein n=1 Tax=Candidatus Arthromitus sp. SFB-rat-Yit TaxID=1041504 RepID=UPI000227A271|nr:hypothetical protein [Candidatus Arthromitus sp. SFB-rat-Yit]BAK80800.1 hypothetical protein RATSFB_0238 [Candidatus Arthromitus sp. SFB-rat-Yit]